MAAEDVSFRQPGNMFVTCGDPVRLQALADSLTARDLERCGQKWLRTLTPFFTPSERRQVACAHRLFFAQVLLAVMHPLVRFAHIAGGGTFTTADLHAPAAAALDSTPDQYRLASLWYDLSKLRAKGLVQKVEHSRRYRLLPQGYRICVLFLKLFERVYAPLTAGLLRPVAADARLADGHRHRLDRLYQRIVTDRDALWCAVGLKAAA